jgi:hypothetical protein
MHLRSILMPLIDSTPAAAVRAQTYFSGTWQCPSADPVCTVPIGDRPNHAFRTSKGKCTSAGAGEAGGIA